MNALTMIRLLAMVLVLSMSGCAAIRVDVDVYKGPMANHKEVQLQQYAAMAIGAKPLLVYLRDLFEREHHGTNFNSWRETCQLGDRFFPDPEDPTCRLQNAHAQRVNAVLSLYEDMRAHPSVEPYVRRAEALAGQYESTLGVLLGTSEDNKIWDQLSRDMLADGEGDLKKGYQKLISPGAGKERDSREVFVACQKMAKEDTALRCAEDDSVNARFDALTRPDVVKSHMKQLFKDPGGKSATILANKAQSIGHAFADRRQALMGLWQLSVKAIMDLHADNSRETLLLRQKLLPQLTVAVAILTQPSLLACALDPYSVATPVPDEVRSLLDSSGNEQTWTYEGKWDPVRYDRAAGALANALSREPLLTAQVLSKAQVLFQEASPNTIGKCKPFASNDLVTIETKESRRYGLTRTLFDDPSVITVITQTVLDIRSLFFKVGSLGFDRGRLHKGIDTLTEDYLRAVERQAKREEFQRRADELSASLVAFAEKVLIVANNHYLLQGASTDTTAAWPSNRGNGDDTFRYVSVLQSVGNSILNMGDELRQRRDYDGLSEGRAGAERQALERTLQSDAREVIGDLLTDLRTDVQRLSTKATTAEGRRQGLRDAGPSVRQAQEVYDKADKDRTEHQKQLDMLKADLMEITAAQCTFTGEVVEVTGVPELDCADKAAKGDADQLRKLAAKDTQITAVSLVNNIKAWIDVELGTYLPNLRSMDPRAARLEQVKRLLGKAALGDGIAEGKGEEVFKAIQGRVSMNLESGLPQIKSRLATMTDLKNRVVLATQALDEAKADQARLAKQSESITSEITAVNAERLRLEHAIKVILDVEKEVLDTADTHNQADSGSVALALLRKIITKKRDEAGNIDEKQEHADALAVLAKRGVQPVNVLETGEPKVGETQRDVMDRLIAFLRHELIQAERRGATAQVENLERVLKRAYDQRGGMAYLRPAMAYLRSVYAATTLQNDPRLEADNMLVRASESDENPLTKQSRKEERLISTEIDKQFWQPINTVQVRGGGDLNYVIAKDDVGNWYVKAYETNPEPVIRAAQSVALFNIGKDLNVNLLRRVNLQRQLDTTTDSAERDRLQSQLNEARRQGGSAESATLRRVFSRHQTAHAEQAQRDYQTLVASFALDNARRGEVKRRILARWDAHEDLKDLPAQATQPAPEGAVPTEDDKKRDDRVRLRNALIGALDAEALAWPDGVAQDSTDTATQVIAIDRALRQVLKFATALTRRLAQLPFKAYSAEPPVDGYHNPGTAEAGRDQAQEAVEAVARAFIDDVVTGRIDSAVQYETSLRFLGETLTEGATNN